MALHTLEYHGIPTNLAQLVTVPKDFTISSLKADGVAVVMTMEVTTGNQQAEDDYPNLRDHLGLFGWVEV